MHKFQVVCMKTNTYYGEEVSYNWKEYNNGIGVPVCILKKKIKKKKKKTDLVWE